jgi:formylglycine-generating enzyme required for sulfatase activity
MRPLPEYELVRKLGAGGFGEVWHARGPGGMDVALKFIKLAAQGSGLEVRAVEVMKNIRHPNLVSCFGVWEKDGVLILAMELCDRTLLDRLNEVRAGKLPGIPVAELLNHMRDAANGLDALNAKKVQHRDVKPLNLLLLDGGVKVADFGLVKLLEGTVASHTGSMTVAYAAPECFKGEVTQQSDQYSLAASYFHLRTGRVLFGGSPERVLYSHLYEEPNLAALAPAERAVVSRALAKDPARRWPSCKEFLNALVESRPSELTGGEAQGSAAQSGGDTEGLARSKQQRKPGRWLWPAVAGLMLVPLLVVAGGYFGGLFTSPQDPPTGPGTTGPPDTKLPDTKPALPPTLSLALRDGAKLDLVLIDPTSQPDGGKFPMGSSEEERNALVKKFGLNYSDLKQEAEHEVQLTRPYYLGKYHVTRGQYAALVRATKYETEAETGDGAPGWIGEKAMSEKSKEYNWRKVGFAQTDEHPVVNVSWNDAKRFCRWLEEDETIRRQLTAGLGQRAFAVRLPSEAEWEYACRAGSHSRYHFGDDEEELALYDNVADGTAKETFPKWSGTIKAKDGYVFTAPVGRFKANKFGLYDLHGNAWQWCEDYIGPYDLPNPDPLRDERHLLDRRVLRGGSWDSNAGQCRAAFRGFGAPGHRDIIIGFRVCVRPE